MSAWAGDAPGDRTPTLQFNSYNRCSVLVRKRLFPGLRWGQPGFQTNRKHVAHVKTIKDRKSAK